MRLAASRRPTSTSKRSAPALARLRDDCSYSRVRPGLWNLWRLRAIRSRCTRVRPESLCDQRFRAAQRRRARDPLPRLRACTLSVCTVGSVPACGIHSGSAPSVSDTLGSVLSRIATGGFAPPNVSEQRLCSRACTLSVYTVGLCDAQWLCAMSLGCACIRPESYYD